MTTTLIEKALFSCLAVFGVAVVIAWVVGLANMFI